MAGKSTSSWSLLVVHVDIAAMEPGRESREDSACSSVCWTPTRPLRSAAGKAGKMASCGHMPGCWPLRSPAGMAGKTRWTGGTRTRPTCRYGARPGWPGRRRCDWWHPDETDLPLRSPAGMAGKTWFLTTVAGRPPCRYGARAGWPGRPVERGGELQRQPAATKPGGIAGKTLTTRPAGRRGAAATEPGRDGREDLRAVGRRLWCDRAATEPGRDGREDPALSTGCLRSTRAATEPGRDGREDGSGDGAAVVHEPAATESGRDGREDHVELRGEAWSRYGARPGWPGRRPGHRRCRA